MTRFSERVAVNRDGVLRVIDYLDRFLHREARERGYLWLVIAFIVTVILAVLAL